MPTRLRFLLVPGLPVRSAAGQLKGLGLIARFLGTSDGAAVTLPEEPAVSSLQNVAFACGRAPRNSEPHPITRLGSTPAVDKLSRSVTATES